MERTRPSRGACRRSGRVHLALLRAADCGNGRVASQGNRCGRHRSSQLHVPPLYVFGHAIDYLWRLHCLGSSLESRRHRGEASPTCPLHTTSRGWPSRSLHANPERTKFPRSNVRAAVAFISGWAIANGLFVTDLLVRRKMNTTLCAWCLRLLLSSSQGSEFVFVQAARAFGLLLSFWISRCPVLHP